MIIANIQDMFGKQQGTEYQNLGHTWVNQEKNCGCMIAICSDVDIEEKDSNLVSELMTRKNVLNQIMQNNCSNLDIEELVKSNSDIDKQLKNFIKTKREQYKFPSEIDCNGEYYFIKIHQNPNCRG